MVDMSATEETSQEPMGWSKEAASANIQDMSATDETSQVEMSWLKEVAP